MARKRTNSADGRSTRLSDEARAARNARIVTAYQQGATLREIAADTGVTYSQVNQILAAAGVPRRPRGFNRHGDITNPGGRNQYTQPKADDDEPR